MNINFLSGPNSACKEVRGSKRRANILSLTCSNNMEIFDLILLLVSQQNNSQDSIGLRFSPLSNFQSVAHIEIGIVKLNSLCEFHLVYMDMLTSILTQWFYACVLSSSLIHSASEPQILPHPLCHTASSPHLSFQTQAHNLAHNSSSYQVQDSQTLFSQEIQEDSSVKLLNLNYNPTLVDLHSSRISFHLLQLVLEFHTYIAQMKRSYGESGPLCFVFFIIS